MSRKTKRYEEFRCIDSYPHGHHNDHRHQSRDSTIDAYGCRGYSREQAEQNKRTVHIAFGPVHQLLSGPGCDTGVFKSGTHNEETSDEDDYGVSQSGEDFLRGDDTGEKERQRDADGNDDCRNFLPDKQPQCGRDDSEHDVHIVHINPFFLRISVSAARTAGTSQR